MNNYEISHLWDIYNKETHKLLEQELPVDNISELIGYNKPMVQLLCSLFGGDLSFNDFFWLIVVVGLLPERYTYICII